ncbi:hypothetical protein AC249_AIPGENE27393 [Exaiptasia diaphana]|nr:hypothetical protein AC249_AIPGENE27393 [Exaiptasia diaphana]
MTSREHAKLMLNAEFTRVGSYKTCIYLFCKYGSKIGQELGVQPTYVYPQLIKDIVRAVIDGQLADYPDPTGKSVYKVKLEDVKAAKWSATKKKQ